MYAFLSYRHTVTLSSLYADVETNRIELNGGNEEENKKEALHMCVWVGGYGIFCLCVFGGWG